MVLVLLLLLLFLIIIITQIAINQEKTLFLPKCITTLLRPMSTE